MTDESVGFGKARIENARHYIDSMLGLIKGGRSFDDILADYPQLERAQLQAMLGFVRDLVAAKRNRLKGELTDD